MLDTETLLLIVVIAGIVWWIVTANIIGSTAEKKGLEKWPWLWISIFMSPVLAVLLLIAHPTGKIREQSADSPSSELELS